VKLDWRGLLVFLGLAIATAASWYAVNRPEETSSGPQPVADERFSYYIKGATITGFNPSGAVLYELNADYIFHDATDNSISLERIRMDYQASPTSSWMVEADEGRMNEARDFIELLGNVKAQRTREPGALATVLRTSALRLEPETSVASSASQVQIEMSGKTLSGTGMHADLKLERLHLEANVHGRFTP